MHLTPARRQGLDVLAHADQARTHVGGYDICAGVEPTPSRNQRRQP